jgi:signal transduction histidine kinase
MSTTSLAFARSDAAHQPGAGLDWPAWQGALARFSAATGLAVSAFGPDAVPRLGLRRANPVLRLLDDGGSFSRDSEMHAFEQQLVAACIAAATPTEAHYQNMLRLRALPIRVGAELRGVVVFGWVFDRFSTSIDAERLRRHCGATSLTMLQVQRVTAPTSPTRFQTYGELLEAMITANLRHIEAIGDLQATSRARDMLLAQVSHELRGPLMTSALRIQLLLDGDMSNIAEVRRQLRLLQLSVEDEADMVEDLIETARTRTGQLNVELVQTHLLPVIERAIEAQQLRAAAKQLVIALTERPRHDLLRADEARLQQVFSNLLANAVKFTPARGRVEVAARSLADELEVRVSDSGIGIEPALLEHVFEPFAQAQPGSHKGLGLGLAVARQLVLLHRGTITVESAGADRGCTFIVRLPHCLEGIGKSEA